MANDEPTTASSDENETAAARDGQVKVHPRFADWYRSARTEIPSGVPELRSSAISDFLAEASKSELLDVVRFFFGRKTRREGFKESFHSHFNSIDTSFPLQGSDHELRVLAGIAVGTLLSENSESADLVALATRCLSLQGELTDVPVAEILEEASQYLEVRAASLRKREPSTLLRVPRFDDLNAKLEALGKVPANQPAEPLKELGAVVLNRVSSFMSSVAREINKQTVAGAARDEELDIVWWLVGASCRFDHTPFRSMPVPFVCLAAAADLADLTKLRVGPIGAIAYLDGALRTIDPEFETTGLSIGKAIDTASMAWRDYLIRARSEAEIEAQGHVVPVLFGIKRSRDAEQSWKNGYEEVVGVSPNQEFHPIRLAMQFYMELLLMKLLPRDS